MLIPLVTQSLTGQDITIGSRVPELLAIIARLSTIRSELQQTTQYQPMYQLECATNNIRQAIGYLIESPATNPPEVEITL